MAKEIVLHKGETCDRVIVNEHDVDWHVVQEEGSTLRVHVVCLPEKGSEPSGVWHSQLTVDQNGKGCRTELYGMGMLRDEQEMHLLTRVHHNVGGGYSSQLFKYVLDGKSRGSFRGDLKIEPNAQGVEAYQTNRNILLSRDAQMTTEPQLEIYADDVKASHGATTGQLDESAIFYMQQRCIDKESAYKLLLGAFFDDVVRAVLDETVRMRLIDTINRVIE